MNHLLYNNYKDKGYKTIKECLEDANIVCSNLKTIRQFANSLVDRVECYHPKARKNVYLYSPKSCRILTDFAQKSKTEKSKISNLLKFGVDNPAKLEKNKKLLSDINKANSEERIIKRNQTNLERYGTLNFINSNKAKQTLINKFGSEEKYHQYMSEERHTRFEREVAEFCKNNDCRMFSREYEPCIKHSADFLMKCVNKADIKFLMFKNIKFIKNSDVNRLNQVLEEFGKNYSHTSIGEKEIADFLKNLGINIVENSKEIIPPKEIDIYVPEKQLAIEFDGLYYHSSKFNDNKNYHLEKTLTCEEKGIRLIHIYEDEWLFKRPIVESIIKSALGIYEERIYARKCEVRKLDDSAFRAFCNENHIQGEASSSERLGLYYNNTLVQAVGFCKSRFSKNEIELIRMVTKLNTQVIGGFSKLMKHFGKNCISFIDRRLFDGKGYKTSGFQYIQTNKPSYFYIKNFNRFYRMNFTKTSIKKKFPNQYDSSLTEEENMKNLGYYRLYDCGTIKVAYSPNLKN